MVGIVLARSSHTRQLVRARAQVQAVEATDRLIAGWWASESGVPIDEDGALYDQPLRWETRLIENERVGDLGARVVRVEVFDTSDDPQRRDGLDEALVTVDLVLEDPAVVAREKAEDEQSADREARGRGLKGSRLRGVEPGADAGGGEEAEDE